MNELSVGRSVRPSISHSWVHLSALYLLLLTSGAFRASLVQSA